MSRVVTSPNDGFGKIVHMRDASCNAAAVAGGTIIIDAQKREV